MPGRQEQSQRSPFRRGGLALDPQGLGLQGSSSTTGSITENSLTILYSTMQICMYIKC